MRTRASSRKGLLGRWLVQTASILIIAVGLFTGESACSDGSGTGGATSSTTSTTATTTSSSTASSASTSTSSTGGSGGNSGVFTPKQCAFEIASRPEYTGFAAVGDGAPVGAAPNIRRVRVGLGGNITPGAAGHVDPSTTIAVGWQTDDDGTRASDVAWGTSSDPTNWAATDRTSGVTWRTPKGMGGSSDERMHEAYVCGLQPSTTYYYRVGGGPSGSEVWSDVESFTTTPSAGPTSVTIGVMSDALAHQNNAWQTALTRLKNSNTTLNVFAGDAVKLADDQAGWETWLDDAAKGTSGYLTLGQTLLLPANGEHDNHSPFFFGNLVLPQEPAHFGANAELFYSVDVGPVHLVVFDDQWLVMPANNPDYEPAFKQWIDADLAAANANRSAVPFVVTVHHHAPYSSSAHGTDADVLAGRAYLTPIYDQYKVDLDLAGHDADYERTKAISGPADNPTVHPAGDATTYVVCAGVDAEPTASSTSVFTAVSRDYTAGGAIGFYGVLHASTTTLQFDAHELRADASDPVFDTFQLTH